MLKADFDLDHIACTIIDAMRTVLDESDFDIARDDKAQTLDVSTDEWTLRIELASRAVAWLAIDDEPTEPSEYIAARSSAMNGEVESALGRANAQLEGMLASLLRASNDPFSASLAAALDGETQARNGID